MGWLEGPFGLQGGWNFPVDPARFVGGSGDCYLTPTAEPDADRRELHLRLYGREQRVLLWGKMMSEEVWGVVNDLRTYATA